MSAILKTFLYVLAFMAGMILSDCQGTKCTHGKIMPVERHVNGT